HGVLHAQRLQDALGLVVGNDAAARFHLFDEALRHAALFGQGLFRHLRAQAGFFDGSSKTAHSSSSSWANRAAESYPSIIARCAAMRASRFSTVSWYSPATVISMISVLISGRKGTVSLWRSQFVAISASSQKLK